MEGWDASTDASEAACDAPIRAADLSQLLDETIAMLRQIAAVDLAELPDSALADVTVKMVRAQQLATAQATRCARRFDRSMVWALDGSRSGASALSRDTGLSWGSCRRMFDRGRHLEDMPVVAEAFAEGLISVDHVDTLVGIGVSERAEYFARDEAQLVGLCATLRHAELTKALRYWAERVDAETGNDGHQPAYEQRHAHIAKGVGDEWRLQAFLDPVGGAIVRAALDTMVKELRDADRDDPDAAPRTAGQLRADALVELCRRGIATPAAIGVVPRIKLTVVCGVESFARLCELSNGDVIGPAALVPYVDRIDVDAVLFDQRATAVKVSPQRCFTGLLRRVIEVRDRHCHDESGCDAPIDRCDVDHIRPHRRGGRTGQHNGELGCHYHNRIWRNQRHNTPLHRDHPPPGTSPPTTGPPEPRTGTTNVFGLAGTRPLPRPAA